MKTETRPAGLNDSEITAPVSSIPEAVDSDSEVLISTECRWGDCCEAFLSADQLGKHLNESHVGKKQTSYVCEWRDCLRNREPLPNRFAVIAHLRRHTGERPYKCEHCPKSFSRSDALNKHTKAQHSVDTEEVSDQTLTNSNNNWPQREPVASQESPPVTTVRMKKHLDYLEAEKIAMHAEIQNVRLKIKRLRAEKLLLLDSLLAHHAFNSNNV